MAIVEKEFYLDIVPGYMPPTINVSEYDIGRAYNIILLNDGVNFEIPSGATAVIEGTVEDYVNHEHVIIKSLFREKDNVTISDNKVHFNLSKDMTAVKGKAWCKVILTLNSEPISTCGFIMDVDRAGVEAETLVSIKGFEEQVNSAVNEIFNKLDWAEVAEKDVFFKLPDGGVRDQALLSDGHDGAKWGSQIPAFAEDPNAPASGTTFEPVDLSSSVEVVNGENWKWDGNTRAESGWWRTNKMAVIPGYQYRFINFPRYMYLYPQTGGGEGSTTGDLGSTNDVKYTAPDGVYFIGFYQQTPVKSGLQMFRVTPTPEEEAALQDPNLKAQNLSLSLQNFKSEEVIDPILPLKGKTIVNLGDSVFGNYSAPDDISSFLAACTGADVSNCGFGGTMMSTHWNADYALFSFHALVDAIISGNWSAQESALNALPEIYATRLATLKAVNFSNVDIVTIAYGTNDWNNSTAIDNPSNLKDVTTYCGAFRYGIENLIAEYPNIRFFVCTPIFRVRVENGNVLDYSNTWQNSNNQTIPDFCDALRNVSAEYGIKCIDNYFELGINQVNWQTFLHNGDGTHPNEAGRKRIAKNMAFGIVSVGSGWKIYKPGEAADYATKVWVSQQGFLKLSDLPLYDGGVS